jgi:lysophospholipase L1-like esterase
VVAGLVVVSSLGLAGIVGRRTAGQVRRLREAGATVPALTHETTVPGTGDTCHLVVLGDSAAAGHGLPDADAGLARQVARRMALRTGRSVDVVSLARDGATTADVLADQVHHLGAGVEVVLVGVGVNDAVRGRTPRAVVDVTARLLAAVRAAAPEADLLLLTCPDLGSAPGLPGVLRPALGWSCRRVAAAQRRVASDLGVAVVPADGHLPPEAFGPDGFHPGPVGVATLADRVEHVLAAQPRPNAATR